MKSIANRPASPSALRPISDVRALSEIAQKRTGSFAPAVSISYVRLWVGLRLSAIGRRELPYALCAENRTIQQSDSIADIGSEMHHLSVMRTTWLLFALISLVAAAIVWAFAAGWAGRVVFLPDVALLRSGEWFGWILVATLMYGPLAFAGWMIAKAIRNKS